MSTAASKFFKRKKAVKKAKARKKQKEEKEGSKVKKVTTQSLRTQVALDKASAVQQRLNMERGAELDRVNEEFFAGQDIRRGQAAGAEQRLTIGKTGEEERSTIGKTGQEQRATIGKTGQEERSTIGKTGKETRLTGLQEELFRRYKENRDYEQSQRAYRS
jgi:hypothetical protein